MSETIPQFETIPEIEVSEDKITSFDLRITGMLVEYLESSENDDSRQYRASKSFEDKIDLVCWKWGENPETEEKSIELKSLRALWMLEKAIFDDDSSKNREFILPVADNYWRRVDERMYTMLSDSVSEAGEEAPAYADLDADAVNPLCMINNYVITRHQGSQTGVVRYAATPFSHSQEAA